MDVTCSMAFNTPVSPASGLTGWTVNNGRTVTSADRKSGADTIITITFDGASCVDTETWTYTYSDTGATDTTDCADRGRGVGAKCSGMNQPLFNISATTSVNQCAGAPALGHTFSQVAYKFFSLREVAGSPSPVIFGAGLNTDIFGVQGAAFAIDIQIDCTDDDCPLVGTDLYYDLNGGTKTIIPNAPPGVDDISWFGLNDPDPAILSGTVVCCLSGALTPTNGGTQREQSAAPTYDLAKDASVVQRRIIKIDKAATVGDKYCFFEFNQTGTILDEGTPNKGCVTIIGGQGGGF